VLNGLSSTPSSAPEDNNFTLKRDMYLLLTTFRGIPVEE